MVSVRASARAIPVRICRVPPADRTSFAVGVPAVTVGGLDVDTGALDGATNRAVGEGRALIY